MKTILTDEQVDAVYKAWLHSPGHENEHDLIRRAARAALAAQPVAQAQALRALEAAELLFACHCNDATTANWLDNVRTLLADAQSPEASKPAQAKVPKANMFHDVGAIAQCQYCKRYTLDHKTLSDRQPVCDCGKQHGWSGSFNPPGPEAQWHGQPPARGVVEREALVYAKQLAQSLFNKYFANDEHYASGRVKWRLEGDLLGVLMQIDNMCAGLSRTALAPSPEASKPVQADAPSGAGEREDWHAPGLGEVHSSDHKAMIYCEAEGADGEMIVSDELARQVCAALSAQPAAGVQKPVAWPGVDVDALLKGCMKPEEIAGDAAIQHDRVRELLMWFVRLQTGKANPKWLHEHGTELAYFIATGAMSRGIDLKAVRDKSFVEGVNVSSEDRAMLHRISPEKFKAPQPEQVAQDSGKKGGVA